MSPRRPRCRKSGVRQSVPSSEKARQSGEPGYRASRALRSHAGLVGGIGLLGAACTLPPRSEPLPPAPGLPIEVLADFDDRWRVDAAPMPAPVWSHAESFGTPGALPDGWETIGQRPTDPTVAALPDAPEEVGLRFGATHGRPATMSSIQRSFAAPASDRVTAQVRVRLDGDHTQLLGPPLLRLQARKKDPKTERWTGAGQVTTVAAWIPDTPEEPWQTLRVTLDLPRDAERISVVLSPGSGRSAGTVTFADLQLTAPSAAENALAGTPISRAYRSADHPRMRSVRTGPDQRPALISPTAETWVLPLPQRSDTLRLRTHVAVPRTRIPDAGNTCWSIETIPAGVVEGVARCDRVGTRWQPVELQLPPEVEGLRFEVAPEQPGQPMAPVAWARPRVERPAERNTDPRPDIVLVVVDTLRADGLGHTGASHPVSPALDRLAATMDRYTRAFATSSWTLPSIASILTGRWPAAHGAGFRNRLLSSATQRGSAEWKARTFSSISSETPLLAERLQEAGYCTEAFVTNSFFGAGFGFQRGFDRFTQYAGNTIVGAEHLTSLLAERDPCDGPRFTVVHLFEPHMPLRLRSDAPTAFADPTALDELPLREESSDDGRTARVLHSLNRAAKDHPDTVRALYDTEVWHADRLLGSLLADIAPPGTGLVLLSDHGELFGEHDRWGHGTTMVDELIRIPLLVRAPDRTGPGQTHSQTVSLVDVTPTLLAWAGIPADHLDGQVLGSDTTGRTIWAESLYKGPDMVTAIRDDQLLMHTLGRGTRDGHASGSGPQWTATDTPFRLADPYAVPDPGPEAHELAHGILNRVHETYPGVHIICSRDDTPTERSWATDRGTLVQVTPLRTVPGDRVQTDRNGRRATANVAAGTTPFEVVVETVPKGELAVPDGCHTQRVGIGHGAGTLDGETLEALEAIGYMAD